MIDWKKVQKDCPKAANVVFEHYKSIHGVVSLPGGATLRNLYDFFDSKDLEIFITPYLTPEGSRIGVQIYSGSYAVDGNKLLDFKTRTEAETAAFTKAFGILEEVLSHNNKSPKRG